MYKIVLIIILLIIIIKQISYSKGEDKPAAPAAPTAPTAPTAPGTVVVSEIDVVKPLDESLIDKGVLITNGDIKIGIYCSFFFGCSVLSVHDNKYYDTLSYSKLKIRKTSDNFYVIFNENFGKRIAVEENTSNVISVTNSGPPIKNNSKWIITKTNNNKYNIKTLDGRSLNYDSTKKNFIVDSEKSEWNIELVNKRDELADRILPGSVKLFCQGSVQEEETPEDLEKRFKDYIRNYAIIDENMDEERIFCGKDGKGTGNPYPGMTCNVNYPGSDYPGWDNFHSQIIKTTPICAEKFASYPNPGASNAIQFQLRGETQPRVYWWQGYLNLKPSDAS